MHRAPRLCAPASLEHFQSLKSERTVGFGCARSALSPGSRIGPLKAGGPLPFACMAQSFAPGLQVTQVVRADFLGE
eukprot:scaffold10393_cov114-Isochrysis_galbana.AAC.8